MPTTINNSQNTVTITDNNANLEITDNNTGNIVNITGVDISTVTVSDVGPKGDKGDPGEYVSGSSPEFSDISVDGKLSHANDSNTEIGFSSDTITIRANSQQQGRFGSNNLQLGNPSNPSPVFITGSTIDVVGTVSSLNLTTLNLGSGGITLTNQGDNPLPSDPNSFSVIQSLAAGDGDTELGTQNYDMSITGDITMGGNLNLSGSHGRGHITASGNVTVTGKVGIGTANPDSDIEIESTNAHAQINIDSGRDASLILDKGAATRRAAIIYKTAGTNNWFVGSADSDIVGGGDDYFIGKTVGGTNAEFFISSSGNIGIGTTSPDNILHITKDQGGVSSALKLENKAGANDTGFDIDFQLASSGLSAKIGAVRTNSPGAGDSDIFFATSTDGTSVTEAMRITHDGNVGIGTTAPSQKLDVNGNIRLGDGGSGANIDFNATERGVIKINGTERMRISGSGNVGIGTTNPLQTLDVSGDARATNFRVDSTNKYIIGNGNQYITGTNDTALELYSGGSSKLYISSSGNVGIGTTSPSRKLHIHDSSGTAYLQLTQASTGTTSNDGFQIAMGAAQVNFINRENGNMVFETNNTEGMRLNNSQNLGIGTTTPSAKLHISTSATDPGLLVDGGSGGTAVAKFRRSEGISPSSECFLNVNFSDSDSQLRFEPTTETNRWSIGASNDDGNFEFAPHTKISGAEVIHLNRDGGVYSTAITASGNISSSGTGNNIFRGNIVLDGDRAITDVTGLGDLDIKPGAKLRLGNQNTDVIEIGRQSGTGGVGRTEIYANTSTIAAKFSGSQIIFNHPITASSDISASGNIFGRQFEQHDMVMNGDIDTTDTFLPFGGQSLAEQAVATNQNVQKIAAVDGRPRRVIIRGITPNTALGNLGYTCSYHQAVPTTGTAVHVASKFASSTGTGHESVTFDFTTGVDSGSYDDVLAGSRVYMSLTADSSISIGILGAVALWEWDYSSI